LLSRLRREFDGRSQSGEDAIGRRLVEIGQIVDMLGDFRVFRVHLQGLREHGSGHVGVAGYSGFVGILYEFGNAMLARNLPVERVIAVGRVGLGCFGEGFFGGVDVTFFHGAHALQVELLRRPRLGGLLCVHAEGRKRTERGQQAD